MGAAGTNSGDWKLLSLISSIIFINLLHYGHVGTMRFQCNLRGARYYMMNTLEVAHTHTPTLHIKHPLTVSLPLERRNLNMSDAECTANQTAVQSETDTPINIAHRLISKPASCHQRRNGILSRTEEEEEVRNTSLDETLQFCAMSSRLCMGESVSEPKSCVHYVQERFYVLGYSSF